MKIYGNNRLTGVNPYQKTNQPSANKTDKTGTQRKDEVQISSEAMELMNLNKAEASERSEKIEQLKAQVKAGTYHVDSQKIADKLFEQLKKEL